MEHTFKAGDKVRVVHGTKILKKGEVVEVKGVLYNGLLWIKGFRAALLEPDNFEPLPHPDMTQNRVPFGLLTDDEKAALAAAGKENCEVWTAKKETWVTPMSGPFVKTCVYRPKPQPVRVDIDSLSGTVEMKDGKPDWSTYEGDE